MSNKYILVYILLFASILIYSQNIYMDSPLNTGANALFYNPSFLGRQDVPRISVDMFKLYTGFTNDLISPHFTAYLFPNSGVTIDYNYFFNDTQPTITMNDTITEEKKQIILHNMGEYFHFSTNVYNSISPILPFNFKWGNFAFAQRSYTGALIHIPRDIFRIALYGNYFDSIYDFSSFHIDMQAYMAISGGLGAEIPLENGMSVNFGISGAYLGSYTYFSLDTDSSVFISDTGYLRQITFMRLSYGAPFEVFMDSLIYNSDTYTINTNMNSGNLFPPPGNGFDLSIGFALNLSDELLLETSYNHAISRIYWGNNGKEYSLRMISDSINLAKIYSIYSTADSNAELSEIMLDSLLYDTIILEENELISILEPELNFGLLYHMKYLPFSAFIRYTQGFKNTAFSSVYPKFTAGVQYTIWNWALLEAAMAIGGREGFQLNLGIGINTDKYTSDINFTQDRGLFDANKGLHFGMNSTIHSTTYGLFEGQVIDSITKEPLIANIIIRRNNNIKVDTLVTDSNGYFSKAYKNTKLSVLITAENYDTIIDSMDILKREIVTKLYKLKPSGGRLLVKVIDGITKEIMSNVMVIFREDTLYTDSLGLVEKRLDEGVNVITVKAENKEDNVFTIEIEKGKNYSKLVKMMPLYGKFRLFTYNASTNKPVKSSIKIYTTDMKTVVDSFATKSDGYGDSKKIKKGHYNIYIKPLEKKYIEQNKYNVELKGGYIKKVDVALLKEKMVFVFNNILFDYNKATIRPESYPVIDSLAQILNENPSIKVEISGHTDSRGSRAYNKQLSQARAESVRLYLIKQKGIDYNRIIAVGYGEDRLLVSPERNEADYQKNRRVEFKVLESR